MKLSIGKRILMFLHWLVSLLICAALAVYVIAPDCLMQYYSRVEAAVGVKYVKIIGIALLAIYALLAVIQICLIFKRKRRADRGFITVDSSDTGRVRIAISAIEQMVRQSVNNIDGITEMKINIDNHDEAILIGVNANIVNGSHVPTITMNMQRAIRQFVETNCGVAVQTVSISINAVTTPAEAPRRRKLGRDKGKEIASPAPATPAATVAPQPQVDETPIWRDEPAPVDPGEDEPVSTQIEPEESNPAPEVPAFDLDKPYESEFAKDLAAMKAAEAAQSAAEADNGDPEVAEGTDADIL